MELKCFVFCPDDQAVISAVIEAASSAGAGTIGNYSHCAFITRGQGSWKAEVGAHPTVGKVGEMTGIPEVKIEMVCPADRRTAVSSAIRRVHPYEEPEIDFVELVE